MTATTVSTREAPPLWDYVPVADYSVPAAPIAHTVKKGLAAFWQVFRREQPASEAPFKLATDLRTLSERQLARVAPAPTWDAAAAALHAALDEWLTQEEAAAPVVLLVGPPYSGHAGILRALAERQGRGLVEPPSPEQVLAGDESWFPQPQDAGAPWVFPALERAYLRHAAGIGLVRRFLDRASSGALGRGIIGCDSWAWAYLQHIWHGRLSVTLVLQAFDQRRLAQIFDELANRSRRQPLLFRQTSNGHYVLPPPDRDAVAGETSQFLDVLAARSRGILGVAWAFWRAGLRTEPDDEDVAAAATEDAPSSRLRTMWVRPWDKLQSPELPPQSGGDEAYVLHALLLHNGLPVDVLQQCLPLAPNQVMETLLRLEEVGLATHQDAVWRVSALGYPAARQFLQAGGYLTDTL
ncbi:MAG: hypothetical protein GX573_16210 [Chloroflexi bacterium]|nr:hypothetical protein [Chloroflexota bacterium]